MDTKIRQISFSCVISKLSKLNIVIWDYFLHCVQILLTSLFLTEFKREEVSQLGPVYFFDFLCFFLDYLFEKFFFEWP